MVKHSAEHASSVTGRMCTHGDQVTNRSRWLQHVYPWVVCRHVVLASATCSKRSDMHACTYVMVAICVISHTWFARLLHGAATAHGHSRASRTWLRRHGTDAPIQRVPSDHGHDTGQHSAHRTRRRRTRRTRPRMGMRCGAHTVTPVTRVMVAPVARHTWRTRVTMAGHARGAVPSRRVAPC